MTQAGQRRPVIPNIPPFVDDWKLVTMKILPEDPAAFSLSPHARLRGSGSPVRWCTRTAGSRRG